MRHTKVTPQRYFLNTSIGSLPFNEESCYVMIGFVCGASVLASSFLRGQLVSEIQPNVFLAILAAVGIGVYILSWYLSIIFFKKREI